MSKILLIDDDTNLTQLLGDYLTGQGCLTRTANDGRDGLRALFAHQPDLIVLDVTMPNKDGWETLARIREVSDVPVIMLTARGEEADVLRGFSIGADDYVTKPFSFAQLMARIRAVLARGSRSEAHSEHLQQGDLVVDMSTRRVARAGEPLALTPTEFKLLVALMRHAREVMPLDELVREVWGPQYADEIGQVRRYVWHLRQKVEVDPEAPRYIHNERGFGYRFQKDDN
jgi:two-component system KDP operon response regulator KdpE